MLELLRRTMLTGVGLAMVTKDKLQEMTDELVKRGELTESQSEEFISEMMGKAHQAEKDLESRVQSMVTAAIDRSEIATKQDIGRVIARLELMERTVSRPRATTVKKRAAKPVKVAKKAAKRTKRSR